MSDVLAFALAASLLITGLTNIQIIRTATMLDMTGIIFVRNKRPLEEAVALARKLDIPSCCVKACLKPWGCFIRLD